MLRLIYESCKSLIFVSFLHSLVGSLYNFFCSIYLYKYAINSLQTGKTILQIIPQIIGIFLFALFGIIFHQFYTFFVELKKPILESYIQTKLQKQAVNVEVACFETPAFYDKYIRALGETSQRAIKVLDNISNIIWMVVNVIGVGALILSVDFEFLLIAFVPLTLTSVFGVRRNKIRHEYTKEKQQVERKLNYVQRVFFLSDYSKELRFTKMYSVLVDRMKNDIKELKHISDKYGHKLLWFAYLFEIAYHIIVYLGTISLAVIKTLIKRTMLLGDCFIVITSITNLSHTINYMGDVIIKLDENSIYIDHLRTFLEYEPQIKNLPDAINITSFKRLSMNNVAFSYIKETEPVLKNINIDIHAGEKIAIVGANGAGKSTLIKLLLRFYEPQVGNIILDGKDISKYNIASYRNMFAIVFQNFKLFPESVCENVLLHECSTVQDEINVQKCLKLSGIWSKIQVLPNGIDTLVSKEFDSEGVVFSGGETQKMALARALAQNAQILLLDEPSSALDPISEDSMYQMLFDVCKDKTMIFVSHRMAAAKMADRIFLIDNGEICETGTHFELIERDGLYAEMWKKQSKLYLNLEKQDEKKQVSIIRHIPKA